MKFGGRPGGWDVGRADRVYAITPGGGTGKTLVGCTVIVPYGCTGGALGDDFGREPELG
jgi:hypothetical protein